MSERLGCTLARHTIACPECDAADVFSRETVVGAAYRCTRCGATFDEAVARPYNSRAGSTAKYADLSPEDVGL